MKNLSFDVIDEPAWIVDVIIYFYVINKPACVF